MPNWCNTSITINHENKEELKKMFDKVQKWLETDILNHGFRARTWLGNILGNSGLADWIEDEGFVTPSGEKIRARSSVEMLEYNEVEGIRIFQEDAWSPMLRVWQLIFDEFLPESQIIYTAEESGNILYLTNDPDYEGKYCIDICDAPEKFQDIEPLFDADEDDVIEILQSVLETEETDIEKLLTELTNADDIDWLWINKWQHCDIENCN
ncbi:MAG: hypothetical protein J6S85_20045 [Methanobrevibacter sp.]|nr:hypothetical protein [Methanobrevibacter sp.]